MPVVASGINSEITSGRENLRSVKKIKPVERYTLIDTQEAVTQ